MTGVAAAGLALNQREEDLEGARIEPKQVPSALRLFWADGLFAAAQDAFILAYLPLLATELGAGGAEIGLLAASQSLGGVLALYPGAMAARHARSRRWLVVLFAGLLGRFALLASAFAVALASGNTALYLVIGLFALRAFLGNFTLPAWTSLAADIIPPGARSRYFASRNVAINLATLAITPLGGLLLDWLGMPGGYVVALGVSFGLGMCATFVYSRLPEPPRAPAAERAGKRFRPLAAARDRHFRTFLAATFVLQFATMIAGPFFNVYLKNDLGASNFEVGLLSTAAAFAGMIGQLYFGDVMARRGALWLTRAALVTMPVLPLMWLGISNPWLVLAPNMLGGFIWSAFNLANFQLLLEVTHEENREEFVAIFHTGVFFALFLAPFLGGVVVDTMGYKAAFALSGGGRVVAAVMFFVAMREPAKEAARGMILRRAETEA